jgi:hypothetical protein
VVVRGAMGGDKVGSEVERGRPISGYGGFVPGITAGNVFAHDYQKVGKAACLGFSLSLWSVDHLAVLVPMLLVLFLFLLLFVHCVAPAVCLPGHHLACARRKCGRGKCGHALSSNVWYLLSLLLWCLCVCACLSPRA